MQYSQQYRLKTVEGMRPTFESYESKTDSLGSAERARPVCLYYGYSGLIAVYLQSPCYVKPNQIKTINIFNATL